MKKQVLEDWVFREVFSKDDLESISPYLMNFTPYFFNLSEFDIANKAIKRIRPILYTFKQIWSLNKLKSLDEKKAALHKILSSVKKDLQGEEKEYIINVLIGIRNYFLQYNPELGDGLLEEVSKEITKELGGESIMKELDLTVAEIIREKTQHILQQGRQEGIGEVLLKFLNADMSIEQVSKITGFSKEKIRKFQEISKK